MAKTRDSTLRDVYSRLTASVSEWNIWRAEHPAIRPNLNNRDLRHLDLGGAHLAGSRLILADLRGANLLHADLREADLTDANLTGANLTFARLEGADFTRARLEDAICTNAVLTGTNLSNASLERASFASADLTSATLRDTNARAAYLVGAKLTSALLIRTCLRGATLIDSVINQADLSSADLLKADLTRADLSDAVMTGAKLEQTVFTSANLQGSDLTKASLLYTVLAETNLKGVRGLDSCHHQGPSVLDHSTITRSGELPLVFLRGCGLPDELIKFLPSLYRDTTHFNSCFISYSSADEEFAEHLHSDLQNRGIRCWFAPHDIRGGKKLHEQIDEAIFLHDRLLLILSPSSMKSEWVKSEIATARQREVLESRRILFPIRLVEFEKLREWKCFDADTGKDSAREIREYYIPDFSNWTHPDDYKMEIEKLLRDLRAETKISQSRAERL